MVATRPSASQLDTLAIDIGGTGLKASVLDITGQMEHARVRIPTPYPLSPQRLVDELEKLVAQLPAFDRVSVGFPGMVRAGQILSAPHFVSPDGPGGTPAPKLVDAWRRFDLAEALEKVTGKPTKVANDADLQGAAVVQGHGLELVVTLGTGVGTALFYEGQLLPHLELAHHPLRRSKSYNEVLGDAARKRAGKKKWRKRVSETIEVLRDLTFFDHCFIGGGNAARLGEDLPDDVTVVSNDAGILGGIKLWERTGDPPTPNGPAGAVGAGAVTTGESRPAAAGSKRAPAKKAPTPRATPRTSPTGTSPTGASPTGASPTGTFPPDPGLDGAPGEGAV